MTTHVVSISGKLHLSRLSFELAFLQPIKKRSHRWMWRPKPGVEAVVESLGQVGCTRSTVVEVRPERRWKVTGDPCRVKVLYRYQRLDHSVHILACSWWNLKDVPDKRDGKCWKRSSYLTPPTHHIATIKQIKGTHKNATRPVNIVAECRVYIDFKLISVTVSEHFSRIN